MARSINKRILKTTINKRILKADDIIKAIDETLLHDWICFKEFRVEAGHGYMAEKRIDLLAINLAPSKGNERAAYEIKVSRSDFLRELRKPSKRWAGMLFTNRFYFAAPKDLIATKEVPDECGLVEVENELMCDNETTRWVAKIKLRAPYRDSMNPTWPFVAAMARRISRKEWNNE